MRPNWPRIMIVTLVFLLFLGNASGLIRVIPGSATLPEVNTAWPDLYHIVLTWEFLLLIAIGLVLSITLPQLEPVPASLLTVIATLPPIYLSYIGQLDITILPMEYYLLTILVLFVVNVLVSYYVYSHQRQLIIDKFSHYVPKEIVHKLCQHPDSFTLEGEFREMTVLFADLVNFTSISEQLDPKELTRLINHHFDAMTTVLLDNGATIDKYMGDSVMAFWGAPLPDDDHTDKAVAAAFAMQQAVAETDQKFIDRGWPLLTLRIGINRGMMNVGNIGSVQRASYTVIGDAVNVAARLEQLAREYRVPIIVSESVARSTKAFSYRQLDRVVLRGKQNPIGIYQPLNGKSAIAAASGDWLNDHDTALALYIDQHYELARSKFSELQSKYPNDGYYQCMLDKTNV